MGLVISQAQGRLDPNTVFACMAIMAVITLAAEYLITLLEKRVCPGAPQPPRPQASEPHGACTTATTNEGNRPCSDAR